MKNSGLSEHYGEHKWQKSNGRCFRISSAAECYQHRHRGAAQPY